MKQVCYNQMPLPWMFLPRFGLIYFPKLDQMDDIDKLDKIDDIMKQNHMDESGTNGRK
jgi:hypothetical protein